MTPDEKKEMRLFETRVRQLILAYREVLARNESLEAELLAANGRLRDSEEALALERKKVEMLRTARILTITGDDQQEAKARVAKLIREVDKCISLLNI